MEQKNNSLNVRPEEQNAQSLEEEVVIPVIQEFLNVDKKLVETGKIHIKKTVVNEDSLINIPLSSETFKIERIAITNKIFDDPPQIRHEGDHLIIPVIKEIVEIRTRYELTEEIHVIKNKTVIPHSEKITLKKESVTVEREPSAK